MTDVWYGPNHQTVSTSCLLFNPEEEIRTILHDGRDCLVKVTVDQEQNLMLSNQVPIHSPNLPTTVERVFSEDGFVMTMACGQVFAQMEFSKCLDVEDDAYFY